MQLKFHRVNKMPGSINPGHIYFCDQDNSIKVASSTSEYKSYSGVKDASYNEDDGILTITNADDTKIIISLSDVTSISVVNDEIAGKLNIGSEDDEAGTKSFYGLKNRLDDVEENAVLVNTCILHDIDDLTDKIGEKQDKITAGDGLILTDNTLSAEVTSSTLDSALDNVVRADKLQAFDDNRLIYVKRNSGGFQKCADGSLIPQAFIDDFNYMAGTYGKWNAESGYFELNGITNIGYAEAQEIASVGRRYVNRAVFSNTSPTPFWENYLTCRTLFPVSLNRSACLFMLGGCSNMEVVRILGAASVNYAILVNSNNYVLANSFKIREFGPLPIDLGSQTSATPLVNAQALETVYITRLAKSWNFNSNKSLSYDSVNYMVQNAINTTAITETVHADVYAKLTGDTTNSACASLTDEERTKWAQILTDATAKNISFATV